MSVSNSGDKYIYKVNHNNTPYILKGYRIQIEHLNPESTKSADLFKDSITIISEVFQEYFFARIASFFNLHFAKPLLLDYIIQIAENRFSNSYMYIEIIFEYAGIGLDKLKSVTFNDAYNFMRQSANALTLLHDIGMGHFNIKPDNMVYDKNSHILKMISMESSFGAVTRRGITTGPLSSERRSITLAYFPPEVSRKIEDKEILNLKMPLDAINVYCWGMSFYSMLSKTTAAELIRDNKCRNLELEENYKNYIEEIEGSLNTIDKDSVNKDINNKVKDLLLRALSYEPKSRPTMKALVDDMRNFEKQKDIKIKYAQTEAKYNKELIKKWIFDENYFNGKNLSEKELGEEKPEPGKPTKPAGKKYDKL